MESFGCGQASLWSLNSLVPTEGGGTEGKCAGDETPTLGGVGPSNRDLTDGGRPEDGLGFDGCGWGGGPSVWQSVPVRIIGRALQHVAGATQTTKLVVGAAGC